MRTNAKHTRRARELFGSDAIAYSERASKFDDVPRNKNLAGKCSTCLSRECDARTSVGAGREKRSTHRWRYAMNRETSHCEHCGTHGRRCEYDDGDQTRCAYTPTRAQYIAAHAEDYRERGAPAPDRSDAECELRAGRRWDEMYGDRIAPTPTLAPVTPVTFTVESDEDARKIAAMLEALGYSVTRERREVQS